VPSLIVVSAPSGAGKSTVVSRVLEETDGLRFSVSHTTRPPRDNEKDGREYYFVDRSAFEKLRSESGLLEWAEVHGNLYGTGLTEWETAKRESVDLLLDLDVQGARAMAARHPEAKLDVAASLEEMLARLERPRRIVLLVNDNEPQGREGGEDRGARPDAEEHLAVADLPPLGGPLRRREPAVEHRDAVAEPGADPAEQLGGEGDLGNEVDRIAAGGAHLLDRAQVDLGLPRTGYAVQHESGVPPRGDGDPDPRKRGLLPGRGGENPRKVGEGRDVEAHRARPRLHKKKSFRGKTLRRFRPARHPQRNLGREQATGLANRLVRKTLLRSHRTFGGNRRGTVERFRSGRGGRFLPGKTAGEGGAKRFAQRGEAHLGRRAKEREVALRHVRRFIEDREKVLCLPPAEGGCVGDRRDQPGHPPPAERDQDANADPGTMLLPEGDPVRERMVDRKRHGHFDEQRRGEGESHARMILRPVVSVGAVSGGMTRPLKMKTGAPRPRGMIEFFGFFTDRNE